MISTNTTRKDWDDFWMNEDKNNEEALFESTDEDRSISSNYLKDVIDGNATLLKRESPLSE